MTTTVTTKQADMIRAIARSLFTVVNGAKPKCLADVGEIWADDVLNSMADGGVITTLSQAGLVTYTKYKNSPRDNCVALTQAGFEVYQSLED